MRRLIFVLTWSLLTFQNVGYAYDGRFTLAAETEMVTVYRGGRTNGVRLILVDWNLSQRRRWVWRVIA